MLTLILLIVALVLFVLAAIPVSAGKLNLVALGLAAFAGAFIASHFGV
jgi:hypothetical protein